MTKRTLIPIALLLLVAVAAWWWVDQHTAEEAPTYKTQAITRGDVRSKVTATGTLQAVTQVLVGSQVSGNIDQVFVGYNSAVKRGQALAQLDSSTYQTQVEQAQASVNNAVASLENARGDLGNASANVKSADAAIVGARAKVQQAQAGVLSAKSSILSAQARLDKARSTLKNAQTAYDRASDLRTRDLIAQADLDNAQATLSGAEADVGSAEAEVAGAQAGLTSAETLVFSAQADVEAAQIKKQAAQDLLQGARAKLGGFQAQVTQAQANLQSARINLQRTTITSPIDGIILDVAVTAGQTVAAQFQAPNLFTLAKNLDQMQVETSVDEADVGRVKVGARASFTVDAFPEESFQGRVSEVRQAPVLTSNVVTYTVIVSTTNPKLLLKPGMTATVEIYDQERENVLLVPDEALRFKPADRSAVRRRASATPSAGETPARDKPKTERARGPRVFTLENGQLVPHRLKTGVSDGVMSEMVSGDLKEGREVVVSSSSGAVKTATPSAGSSRGGGRRGMRMF